MTLEENVTDTVNGRVSFWLHSLGASQPRPSLDGSIEADVCVVGAGLTGLWTAYYLKKAAPSLRVVVLEQRFAGFGASGRNGGWLSAAVAGSLDLYAARRGADAARDLQRAMIDTVDEVIRVARVESLDADIVKGGVLRVARTAAQMHRLEQAVRVSAEWGDAHALLSAREATDRVNVHGAHGASFSENGARVHPAKLVRGLADLVTALGVPLYELTPVREIQAHRALTPRGTVTARVIVRATEGFSASFASLHRQWLPMNSSMIITEPLAESAWREIGWRGAETLGDSAHTFMYAQRTADGRLALGGRGVPYRFASRVDAEGETPRVTVEELAEVVTTFFPMLRDARIEHAWSGVLGVPRDWCASVGLDVASGVAHAGGYVGHGVAATNLAGRTLRDLILGEDTELTHLPWVGWRSRRWEPEPLRWLGVRSLYLAYRAADRAEASGRPTTSRIARVADVLAGRQIRIG